MTSEEEEIPLPRIIERLVKLTEEVADGEDLDDDVWERKKQKKEELKEEVLQLTAKRIIIVTKEERIKYDL